MEPRFIVLIVIAASALAFIVGKEIFDSVKEKKDRIKWNARYEKRQRIKRRIASRKKQYENRRRYQTGFQRRPH